MARRDTVPREAVTKVLVSNNSELLRHFTAPPFQRLDLQLLVAGSADEAHELFRKESPALAVIDAELGRASCRERVCYVV